MKYKYTVIKIARFVKMKIINFFCLFVAILKVMYFSRVHFCEFPAAVVSRTLVEVSEMQTMKL